MGATWTEAGGTFKYDFAIIKKQNKSRYTSKIDAEEEYSRFQLSNEENSVGIFRKHDKKSFFSTTMLIHTSENRWKSIWKPKEPRKGLPYPLYSPDFTPSEYNLFRSMTNDLSRFQLLWISDCIWRRRVLPTRYLSIIRNMGKILVNNNFFQFHFK